MLTILVCHKVCVQPAHSPQCILDCFITPSTIKQSSHPKPRHPPSSMFNLIHYSCKCHRIHNPETQWTQLFLSRFTLSGGEGSWNTSGCRWWYTPCWSSPSSTPASLRTRWPSGPEWRKWMRRGEPNRACRRSRLPEVHNYKYFDTVLK